MHFFGCDEQVEYEPAEFVVLMAPVQDRDYKETNAENGPKTLVAESSFLELADFETEVNLKNRIHVVQKEFGEKGELRKEVKRAVESGKKALVVGGEHNISPWTCGEDGSEVVLYLDAHADLRLSFFSNPESHACAARRMHESGKKIVFVGMRSASKPEREFIEREKLRVFPGSDWNDEDVLGELRGKKVHVSFDLDCVNPAEMPCVAVPEMGGPSIRRVFRLLKRVFEECEVRCVDLVEFSPNGIKFGERSAAQIAQKILCWWARGKGIKRGKEE